MRLLPSQEYKIAAQSAQIMSQSVDMDNMQDKIADQHALVMTHTATIDRMTPQLAAVTIQNAVRGRGFLFYAVAVGRETGVFDTWARTHEAVYRYPGACYKGFHDSAQAAMFIQAHAQAGVDPFEIVKQD